MKEREISDLFNIGLIIHNSPYQLFRFIPSEDEANHSQTNTGVNQDNSLNVKRNVDYHKHNETVEKLNNPKARGEHYCYKCKKERVFRVVDKIVHTSNYIKSSGGPKMFHEGIIVHEYECSANQIHRIYFIYKVGKDYIMKVGQYPSMEEIVKPPNKEFIKIMGDIKFREYIKAITLNSTGVGIGAFVYLRRILEELIEKAHNEAKSEINGWNEANYNKSRFKEKIKLLQNLLPQFLVENRQIYGILSKGIHELTESECKKHFNVMKSSIDVIVEEKLESIKKEKHKKELMKEINKINQQLK